MSADGVSVLAFAAGAACAAAGCAAQQHRRISRLEELAAADRRRRSERDVLELFDSVETASRQRYPRRVILIRHGESEGNTNLSIYKTKPDAALRLTAQGRQQALSKGRALREELGDSKVHFIVSPYTRTRETMHYILQAFSPEQYGSVVEDPRIREQEFGMFQDPEKMPEIMRERRKIGAFYYRFPDGESGADVYDRVDNFVEHLHRTFKRPAERGKNRRPQVVSRTDRHGRTRSMSDVKTEGRTYDGRTPDPSPTVRPPQTLVTGAGKSAGRVCAPIRRAASIDSPELVGESAEGEALHPLRRAQSMDDTAAGATAETVIIVTHGLTARLFLMRWFHLTVDQFHSLWNLRNCGSITMELFKDERDSRARYMLTAPVEAGGQFPPPHTDMFVDGRNSTEPCTWGITLDEAAALWDKHVSCTAPAAAPAPAAVAHLRKPLLALLVLMRSCR